jgi:hypothetical protein
MPTNAAPPASAAARHGDERGAELLNGHADEGELPAGVLGVLGGPLRGAGGGLHLPLVVAQRRPGPHRLLPLLLEPHLGLAEHGIPSGLLGARVRGLGPVAGLLGAELGHADAGRAGVDVDVDVD